MMRGQRSAAVAVRAPDGDVVVHEEMLDSGLYRRPIDGWLSLTIEGLIRLGLLIGYLALIGRIPDIQRVFEYHGAEHKAINALEAGQPLDVAHVRAASRVHTRCGTGFLLIVVVLSIIVF